MDNQNNPDDIYGTQQRNPGDIYGQDSTPKPNPYSGDVADAFFQHDSFGRILNAFGTGAKQNWGAGGQGAIGLIARNQNYVEGQKDWSSIHKGIAKSLNTAFLRPLYGLAGTALDTFNAGMGGVFGAAKEASDELMETAASPGPSMFPGGKFAEGALGESIGALSPQTSVDYRNPYTGETQTSDWMLLPEGLGGFHPPEKPFMDRAVEARAKGHIGEGEEGFFNTVPPTPEELLERKRAAEEANLPPAALTIRPMEVDPDKVARLIDPDTYKELDGIKDLQENLRLSLQNERTKRQISLQTMPENHPEMVKNAEGISDLQGRIQDTDEKLRDMIPEVNQVRARADEYLRSDSPEGQAFRDFIQSKLLEAELRQDADLAVQHADTLMPDKDPVKIAEEQLKEVDNQHQAAVDGAPDEDTNDTSKSGKSNTSTSKEIPEVVKYVNDYLAGKGRGNTPEDLQMQQFAQNHGPEIEKEFDRRTNISAQPQVEEARENQGSGIGKGTPEFQQGTGPDRTHGLSRSVEEKAIENQLVDNLGELPEYASLNMKDEAQKAINFKDSDWQKAVRVAKGHEEAPEGVHPIAVFMAVEKEAQERGDVNLIRDLAFSELRKRVTQAAQDLRILRDRSRLDTSAVDRLQDVVDYRINKIRDQITNGAFETGELLKEYMDRASSSPDDAINFIRSIECDY